MKSILILIFISMVGARAYCQQTTKVDDGLLLDYYQNQKFAEASDYLKKVYAEPVTDIKALSQLAYTTNMAGRLAAAEGYYQRIYDIDSSKTGVLYSLGSINLRRGNMVKAENYYKKIISKDTTNFVVYKQLAQISHDKNDMSAYIVYLQKANRIDPTEPDVASDLSDVYVALKLNNQAEKVLDTAITADPENIVLLNSLMKLQYAEKKWPQTISTCLKLVVNGNTSGTVLSKLGVAYYNTKNYDCSISAFVDMDGRDKNETSYYYTGLAYKALKDQPMAVFNLLKAVEQGISPNVGAYYGEIADSHEKQLNFKKAIAAYQKSLQFDESPMIYYAMANVYDTNLKDKKSAIRYYKMYLASKPPADKQKSFIDYSKSRVERLLSSR